MTWPIWRALVEMRDLWQRPHQLDGTQLQALLGSVPQTPLGDVVRQCIAGLPAAQGTPAPA